MPLNFSLLPTILYTVSCWQLKILIIHLISEYSYSICIEPAEEWMSYEDPEL